jgi:Tfp pilus assembly PilM family ATPase
MSRLLLASTPPTVAIEIASRRLTVVEVTGTGSSRAVSAYASEPLVSEAVMPALVGPNIPNVGVVADALRRALDRAGLRSPRRAALIVPDSVARVSLVSFEHLPAKASDVDQLISWQLKKAMPFPIEEAQVSHFDVHVEPNSHTVAAVVARKDVLAQYEAVTSAVGIHAGLVDLASFNVMNAVLTPGAAASTDTLVVCLAAEATTLAILRGTDLMFYRHRATLDDEPLSALVHQTAMYHEDRLGGSKFSRVFLCGGALAGGAAQFQLGIADRLGVSAEPVDIRIGAALRDRIAVTPEVLDALAAPVGVLLRERKAA